LPERVVSFGPFRLFPTQRRLLEAEKPVPLGDRALDLLIALVERAGELVPTEELIAYVWPNTFVEAGNLKVHVAALRQALKDGQAGRRYLVTIRGRGYRFVAPVAELEQPPSLSVMASPKLEHRVAIVTTLFTDIADAATVQVGEEGSLSRFEEHHRLLSDAASVCGGAEVQWLGDGLMAAFPSAADALRCAIAMQQTAAQKWGMPSFVRVGVNVGELFRPKTGSGPFGTSILLAKRLCTHAQPGQILCSHAVSHLLAGRAAFAFRELPQLALEGGAAKVAVCEVVYEVERASALLVRTPLAGRRSELAKLERRLEKVRAGTGSLAFIAGEAGIGKTRLLEEFAARARGAGVEVLGGRCFEGDFAPPFGAFAEAIASYAKESNPDVLRGEIAGFGGVLVKLVPELRERLPDLPAPMDLAPEEERARLLDAVAQLLWAVARRTPVVVILDDLHWAEGGTLALLRYLARFVARHRVLLVAAYRDVELGHAHPLQDTLHALRREHEFEPIALGGLDQAAVTDLLGALAKHQVPTEFVEVITAETGGNPFFLREVLLQLLEEGKIERTGGRFTSRFSIQEMGIPEGVRQVMRRRLAGLSKEANRLLAAASGCAGGCRFDIMAAASGLKEREALDALDEALESQLLQATSEPEVYEFSHALLRHTVASELSPSRKARIHRRLAEEMEKHYRGDAREHAFEIAQQWRWSAALPGAERGVVHCLVAADRAEETAAHEDAASALRVALVLLPPGDVRRPRLLARLGLALARSLENEEAVRVASEAGELLAASEGSEAAAEYFADAAGAVYTSSYDPRAWALAASGLRHLGARRDLTWALLASHDLDQREASDPEFGGLPLDLPERLEVSRIFLANLPSLLQRGMIIPATAMVFASREDALERARLIPPALAMWAGEYAGALALARPLGSHFAENGRLAIAAALLTDVAHCEAALGNLAASQEALARAVELAGRVGNPAFIATFLHAVPIAQAAIRGEGHGPLIDSLLAQAATPQNRWFRAAVWAATAVAYAHTKRVDDALQALERVLPAVERAAGWAVTYTLVIYWLVEALWVLGRHDHAERLERNLREKTLAPDFRFPHTDARLALARLCALTDRIDEARQWFEKARRVLDSQGARPLRAVTDFDEAWMEARRGRKADRPRALALLDAARGPFEEIGMPGWLRHAGALRQQLAP
jgi:DNA-binding winged helix-turn-helix (wHTH) protein/tetratricopeptide (TPR) repeat protein